MNSLHNFYIIKNGSSEYTKRLPMRINEMKTIILKTFPNKLAQIIQNYTNSPNKLFKNDIMIISYLLTHFLFKALII